MPKTKQVPRITNAKELLDAFNNLTPKRKKDILSWLDNSAYKDANEFVLDRNTVNGDNAWNDYNVLSVCQDYLREHLFIKLIDGDIYNQTPEQHEALTEFYFKGNNVDDFEHQYLDHEVEIGDGTVECYYHTYYVLASPSHCRDFLTGKNI